jgi:hypothetical protein
MATQSVTMSASTKIPDSQAAMLKKYPHMTPAQYKAYTSHKNNFFKGTIAVCVTYAVFAFGLLIISSYSESSKEFIGDTMMPFTITFVIGTVLIVIGLVLLINSYKPVFPPNNLYDKDVCPDYWILEPTPTNELNNPAISLANKSLMGYRCRPNPNIYNYQTYFSQDQGKNTGKMNRYQPTDLKNNVYNTDSATSRAENAKKNIYGHIPLNINTNTDPSKIRYAIQNNTDVSNLKNQPALANLLGGVGSGNKKSYYLNDMYGTTTIGNTPIWNTSNDANNTSANKTMMCDMVYPNYLSAKDTLDFPNQPNQYRCAWAKECGIPWTTACPDSNDTLPNDINVNIVPGQPTPSASTTILGPAGA